jgi:hypothetical protein
VPLVAPLVPSGQVVCDQMTPVSAALSMWRAPVR